MRNLLRGSIETRPGWARTLLGWVLLTAGLLTPLAVLLITSNETLRQHTSVQQPRPQPTYFRSGKRDPFKSPFDRKKEVPRPTHDVPPPRSRRPAGPAGLLVNDAQLAGIVEGLGGKVAMITGDGSVTYFLQEGDRLFDGYLRQISDGAVRFVREIKISSRVVDQQEITKRINPAP